MKKLSLAPLPKLLFSLLFLTLSASFTKIVAQSTDCGVDIPEGYMQALTEEVPEIEQWAAQRGPVTTQDIPVRVTLFHGPQGWFGSTVNLSSLNSAFGPAGFNFISCTPVNEIWDERIKYGVGSPFSPNVAIDQFFTLFSYTSGSMEVYQNFLPGSNTAVIPLPAYQDNNPNYYTNPNEHMNWVNLKSVDDKTFIHETGHHLGLLHTFMPNKVYDVPAIDENTFDYPYKWTTNGTDLHPSWWGRELVIRGNDNSKTFKTFNYNIAGDLVEDTPADCAPGYPTFFPGCPATAQNSSTCDFNSNLTYTDYNGDAIYPPPSGYSLGRNYMSYWANECKNEFTPKQNVRLAFYYEKSRKDEYAVDKCGNFTDKVEFEGTNLGLHNVTARVRHTSTTQKCNVTTSEEGDFAGLLHADDLKAYVYHNGQKNTMAYPGDLLRIHYDHTSCEWLRGVNTSDLSAIRKHILAITPFTTGYQKIAADANKSNSVTTFDIVELRKLILGIYITLPNHEQPWRYVPEIITQNYITDFNYNPFNVTSGGGNAYLEQGWQFTLTGQDNGKKGFDGIKIGDVNASWLNEPDCPNETVVVSDEGVKPALTVPSSSLTQNQVVALTFKVNSFQQVEAFQLGIRLPYDCFELLDVKNTTLQSYTEADNFGLTQLEENAVRTLWFNENGSTSSLENNSTLFSLEVRAKQPIANLQSVLKLDNSILPNQFWQTGTSTEPVSLTVSVEVVERTDGNLAKNLLQERKEALHCYPNPFTNNILLTYAHEGQSTQGELRITNAFGVEIYRQLLSIEPGENTLTINSLKDAPKGMYTVSLQLDEKTHATNLVKE